MPTPRFFSSFRTIAVAAALVLQLAIPTRMLAQTASPKRILETTQPISGHANNAGWAGDVCGNTATFSGGARYEWTPVNSSYGQYGSVEAVSGWALNSHESGTDLPFTHPFDKKDFDYLVLPDPPYLDLLAPRNGEVTDAPDDERQAAKDSADGLGLLLDLRPTIDNRLAVVPGLLAVEQDRGLIPETFRAKDGNRVAVFGRWIIDCGHDNWQSEIHPPLLSVVARAEGSRTRVTLIGNPYLVDQEFPHGGIVYQLAEELALINSPILFVPFNDQIKAQASFLPSSKGLQIFSFKIRPPASAPSPQHRLYIRFHITVRPGVVVQPFWVDDETVGVVALYTDQLTMLPITGTKDWNVTGSELNTLHPYAGKLYDSMTAHMGLFDPIKMSMVARGIKGILYSVAPAPDVDNAPLTEGWTVRNPGGQNPVRVNPNQPFPLIGWMELEWRIPTEIIASSVSTGPWEVIERHLNEISNAKSNGPPGANIIARYNAAASMLAEVAPKVQDNVSGEWRYRLRGPGSKQSLGRLWLRANGPLVEGVLEVGERRDKLKGEIQQGGGFLHLVWIDSTGKSRSIRLGRKAAQLEGPVEGVGSIELRRP